MRFALRNKDKLVNAFGIEAHQLLLDSLKGTGDRFKFAIIKKVYDVYHVAFVEHMKN
jgi:hypothetical protein